MRIEMNPIAASLAMTTAVTALGGLALYGLLRMTRARVYDVLIVGLTAGWYTGVLERVPKKSLMLDVGIGTGLALVRNGALLKRKDIHVDGVDYDGDYVSRSRELVRQEELTELVNVRQVSIYDFSAGPYDAVYFSGSLMLLPDAVQALKHCAAMLKPKSGRIYITQTVQTRRSKLMELGKPLLKFLTTIDFGSVTYERELLDTIEEAGLTVCEHVAISGASMDSMRSFRLLVLKP